MKLRNFSINDKSLLDPSKKSELENLIIATFQKAQAKAQEVAAEKTKDLL
jgi:DNA-binding protein YbaB